MMFVDWNGVDGLPGENAGDIYIDTKNEMNKCDDGVGKIPVSVHKNVAPGETSLVYDMGAVLQDPPSQGPGVNCSDGPFRMWTGADMIFYTICNGTS
jgi:hypothetical protein